VTFYDWYRTVVVPVLYDEQQPYERESIGFQAIETLSKEDLLGMFQSMREEDLRLAFFDHIKNCMAEQWDPDAKDDFSEEV
jgi:hypothetical protein